MKRYSYDFRLILLIVISHLYFSQVSSLPDKNLAAPINQTTHFFLTKEPPTMALDKTKPTPKINVNKNTTTSKINIEKTTITIVEEKDRNYILVFNNIYDNIIKTLYSSSSINIVEIEDSVLNQISTAFGRIRGRFKNLNIKPNAEKRTAVSFTLTPGMSVFDSIEDADKTFKNNSESLTVTISTSRGRVVLESLVAHCSSNEGGGVNYDASCKIISKTNKKKALLALIIIPILVVILIIILVLLWFFKYKKPKETNSVTLNELGYMKSPSQFGGTINNKPPSGLSIANSTVRSQVYTTMGKNYGFSLDNADFTPETFDDVNLN